MTFSCVLFLLGAVLVDWSQSADVSRDLGGVVCDADICSLGAELKNDIAEVKQLATSLADALKGTRTPKGCPSGYVHDAAMNSCYRPVTEPLTWDMASLTCKAAHENGHLAFINSSQEQTAVAELLLKYSGSSCYVKSRPITEGYNTGWWIGAQRVNPATNSLFVWKTGEPFGLGVTYPLAYHTGWINGEPNFAVVYGPESCAYMAGQANFKWNDIDCTFSMCYVCEIDLQ